MTAQEPAKERAPRFQEGCGEEAVSDAAAIPVVRDTILGEYADGDLRVRVLVQAGDVDAFWRIFPESNEAAFLACGEGAIEAVRGAILREYRDGSLAVKLLVGPAHKRRFRELWPRPGLPAVLAREAPERGREAMMAAAAAAEPKPVYGQLARALRTSPGFMLNPKVWRAVGSDEDYLGYIRTLRCAHCQWVPHWDGNDFVPCHAAHVRRIADGAGTAIKPPYSAIPLCERCHREQHQKGESYLGGKEHVDRLRLHYVQEWVWAQLKETLGYQHWNEVPPSVLIEWAEDAGVVEHIPRAYFEAARAA